MSDCQPSQKWVKRKEKAEKIIDILSGMSVYEAKAVLKLT